MEHLFCNVAYPARDVDISDNRVGKACILALSVCILLRFPCRKNAVLNAESKRASGKGK
jgi:hypothetical protein